jgi:hypothetical protein
VGCTNACRDTEGCTRPRHSPDAENRDHAAVEIKDQAGTMVRQVDQRLQQSIIHAIHLLAKRVGRLVQETA